MKAFTAEDIRLFAYLILVIAVAGLAGGIAQWLNEK